MRSGARVDGMVNTCEPLINVVSDDKRKRLTDSYKESKRLDQKVKGQV